MSKNVILKDGREVPEGVKASLLEEIVYFNESDLELIGEGYISGDLGKIDEIPLHTDVRYFLENDYTKRHPIPYVLLKYNDKYYLADRLKGGTEARLHGKKGMLGGHVDKVDLDSKEGITKSELFKYAMLRELKEEVGVLESDISNIDFKGYIRIVDKEAVEGVHLALVYIVDITNEDITSAEEHILKGNWYTKEEIKSVLSTLEKWCSMVIAEEVLK